MIKQIIGILRIKSPTHFTHNYSAAIVVIIFLSVFLVLYFLTPFGLVIFPKNILIIISLSDSIIASISYLIIFGLFRLKDHKSSWEIWKEILVFNALFFTASILIYFIHFFLSLYLNDFRIHLPFSICSIYTLSVSIILLIFLKLIDVLYFLSNNNNNNNNNNNKLIDPHVYKEVSSGEIILFEGRNKKEKLYVKIENIIVIKSLGNYLKIIYTDEHDQIKRVTIRNTIAYALNILESNKNFFKCHRSYIINLDKVYRVYKRSNKYIARMIHIKDNDIPISNNVIKDFLKLKKLHE